MVIEKLKKVLEALEYIMLERSLDSATTIARNARYFLREAIEEADSQIVAWMFQHSETGRITFVEHHQIENGWEKGNPRYNKIGPLYTTPQQRKRILFPTMLRKMWSGGEVQAWLDENVNQENA
jgi:hypothetical protein